MQRDDSHILCETVNGHLCMHCRHCTTAEPIPHPIKISWLEAMFATFKKPHLTCVALVLSGRGVAPAAVLVD